MKRRNALITSIIVIIITAFLAGGLVLYKNPASSWNIYVQYLAKDCSYPEGSECTDAQACIFLEPQKSICVNRDSHPEPEIAFPKLAGSNSVCTQGPRTAKGRTHSYLNSSFAVDLATPEQESNAQVVSVFDGEALVHTGCDNNDNSKFNNDGCGYGFGNWIVIFDSESDLVVLFAHLRDVRIKDGERVRKGQVIGDEGKTGAAGHRHLHFSVHRNIWKISPELFKKSGFWLPPSIAWRTKIRDEAGTEKVVRVNDLPCEDNSDLTRPPFQGG